MSGSAAAFAAAVGLARAGRTAEAMAACDAILASGATDADAAGLLGTLRGQRGEWRAALDALARAVTWRPEWADMRVQLGHALMATGHPADARAHWAYAVQQQPDVRGGYESLVMAALHERDYDAIARVIGEAAERMADPTEVVSRFAIDVIYSGRSAEAVVALRRAMERRGRTLSTQRALALPMLYWEGATAESVAAELRELGRLLGAANPRDPRPLPNDRDPERRLRVGLVSQDFRSKATGHFIEAVFAHHDRSKFELMAYSTALSPPDDLAARLRASAAAWVDVPSQGGVVDPGIFQRMRADRLDLAVDLVGHPPLNTLTAFARRVAPVQATWIGFPSTTGLAEMDVRLIDAITDPPGHERFASERLVRLDGCFLCYTPPPFAPAVAPVPSAAGAPITFGSFNTAAKIEPGVVRAWAAIVRAVPGSRLVLKNHALGAESVRRRYEGLFAAEGVDGKRLVLMGETPGKVEHLASYGMIDIALDPFPYNGTTTTVEALWMGVPVVTVAGDRHASRVGMSLLTAVGVPELIAGSVGELTGAAATLARDATRLAESRRTLRPRMAASTLCDGPAFTRRLEGVWRGLWRESCGR